MHDSPTADTVSLPDDSVEPVAAPEPSAAPKEGAGGTPGERLRRSREAAELTQGELAERVGVALGVLVNLEKGTRELTPVMARRIAVTLEVDPTELLPDLV